MHDFVWSLILSLLFLIYSLPLFVRVYATTQMVIDEEFHLKQGLHFCNKRFDVWDNKITTFPGLYLFSLILNPFNFCSVLGLRLISLVAAAVNVILLYIIRKSQLEKLKINNKTMAALEAFTIAALPPLYFFSHLYYTDTLSLTMVLVFYLYWQRGNHLQAAVFAAASVLLRQTNVIWVGMSCACTALDIIVGDYANFKKIPKRAVNVLQPKLWLELITNFKLLFQCIWHILKQCSFYIIIILPFLGFVFLNKSIVLGDKRAHVAALHVPQLFYFAAFTCIFAITNTLQKIETVLRTILSHKLVFISLLLISLIIVKYNTLVHPYLLADNRHYTFYIWQRFYGRYIWFKYAMCPIYLICLTIIYQSLQHLNLNFILMFYIAVFVALCFQRLLEIRYFLIPFVLFRLNIKPNIRCCIPQWLELSIYVAINALTFYIFFTKEIKWKDYKESQRIIW
uniref:Dol-P-Glc:Glc(2)Man(9)GlcNAc(2)-PP-Dol alpha-1,2-glucosyltransferase n=1 Tax=Glossina brevipalpis TaxID=37001 RepID=A0A1A9WE02_9MUSC